MSEIKHTPGPWANHGRILERGLPHSGVVAETLIARVYSKAFGDIEQEIANANLIAAAPELLEAVQAMIEWDDRENDFAVDFNARMALCHIAFDKARAALAKVTGSAS